MIWRFNINPFLSVKFGLPALIDYSADFNKYANREVLCSLYSCALTTFFINTTLLT